MMAATVASLIQQIVVISMRIIKGVANVINLIDVQSVC